MDIPDDYQGREQSYLKHRVLAAYLAAWGHKLGSLARTGRVKLWYIDCFAGPWQSRDQELRDTSIAIGLNALEEAASTWKEAGHDLAIGAIFVEKNAAAYQRLQAYLEERRGTVETKAWHGEFGYHAQRIAHTIGTDPAFVFIDPTGFKGVNMSFIAPLARERMRDVMVNVMFNDINRWKYDSREFLRTQMADFFGLADDIMPPGLSEIDLLALYRQNLKRVCDLTYAADLAVPHPSQERTWFRLVIGGNHPQVLALFRDIESKVMGREAAAIRAQAKDHAVETRTKQLSLGGLGPPRDPWYHEQNRRDLDAARARTLDYVSTHGATRFGTLWPDLLQELHVTRAELARCVLDHVHAGALGIDPAWTRRRTVHDDDLLQPRPR